MNRLIFFLLFILQSCSNLSSEDNNSQKAILNTKLLWNDLVNNNDIINYFDSSYFTSRDLSEISSRFKECNIDTNNINFVSGRLINDGHLNVKCYELKYSFDSKCGHKMIFVTYDIKKTDKIIGLQVASK